MELRKVGAKNHCNQHLCLAFRGEQDKKIRRWKLSYVYDKLPCSGYWDLYSKRHDNSELSFLGDASGKIPWSHGISELDCELPNRSLLEGEKAHARIAVDRKEDGVTEAGPQQAAADPQEY